MAFVLANNNNKKKNKNNNEATKKMQRGERKQLKAEGQSEAVENLIMKGNVLRG